MSQQSYTGTYRAAMEAATIELDTLFEEAKRLRNRMEQIDSAINALKPLVSGAEAGKFSQEIDADTNSLKQQIDAALGMVAA